MGLSMVLLRKEIGHVLRTRRKALGRTLRDVSASSAVSLGYLSEIERGEKEASSELLASIAQALELQMSEMLAFVSERMEQLEVRAGVVVSMTPQADEAGTSRPAA